MPRTETFQAATLRIEAQRTDSGWVYTAWRPHTSRGFTDAASLLRWCGWPAKTPTGDALRQWLAGLEGAPQPEPETATTEESSMVAGT
jgi:hypothetical protein